MSEVTAPKQVEDNISKLNGEVAVGEDLGFQRKWWKFEHAVWILFALALVADLAGAFGRGPLAKAERRPPDNSFLLHYDRIQRTSTPSILTIDFSPTAIRNGKVSLYAGETLVNELGAQRVIPSPESATVGNGGLTYSFPATIVPASISFALEPTGPGLRHLTLQVPNLQPLEVNILVFP